MAIWHRMRPSTFNYLYHHCIRWHSFRPGASADPPCRLGTTLNPLRFAPVRSFAAPVQANPKPSADDFTGPRLNEAITSPFVRLVTDEGHGVVSRWEALDRARRLNLDLVEVQRTADPPVCKLMDFHKEKFKQEAKEKERAKSKSAVTLRTCENKEIRFKAKTELKDLKMKAETITRLMERGYRVKCTAMPTGKEDEDLEGLLTRLLAMIEDISVVESGPHLDTKHAHVIVRHVKFASKKSGKKTSKVLEATSKGMHSSDPNTEAAVSDAFSDNEEEWEPTDASTAAEFDKELTDEVETKSQLLSNKTYTSEKSHVGEANRETRRSGFYASDFRKIVDVDSARKRSSSAFTQRTSDTEPKPLTMGSSYAPPRSPGFRPDLGPGKARMESRDGEMNKQTNVGSGSSHPEPSIVESNRYRRQGESKGNFNQPRPTHTGAGTERIPFNHARQQQQQPPPINVREERQWDPRLRQFYPNKPPSPPPRLGIFQASKASGSGNATVDRPHNSATQSPKFGIFSAQKVATTPSPDEQRKFGDASGGKLGIFSSPAEQRSGSGDITADKPNNSGTGRQSYGIFSSTEHATSGDQRVPQNAPVSKPSNPSSPTSRYGIFSSNKE